MRRLFLLTPAAKNDLKQILLDIAEDSPDPAEVSALANPAPAKPREDGSGTGAEAAV